MVQEALSSGFKVVSVWRREEIGEAVMARISQFATPSPVLAVVARPAAAEPIPGEGLYLGLDGVRDPGNLGTILRLADWFGVEAVFVSEDCVEEFNPKTIQSSMGSIFRVQVVKTGLVALCRRFRDAGKPVYGTFLDGRDIYREPLSSGGLVLMGNESSGIRPEVAAEVDSRLRIPSFGRSGAESLNVAAATAVTLSEFRRR